MWKLPVWAWIAIGLVLIGAAASGGSKKGDADSTASTQSSAPATEPENTTVSPTDAPTTQVPETTSTPDTTLPATTEAPTTVPPTEPPATLPGFDDGKLLVGSDIQPGLYLTVVPSESFNCYWARLSGLSGDFNEILANNNSPSNAHLVVEITPTDVAFESTGCGRWTAYFPPTAPANTFTDGVWMVGLDIAPGRYRSSGPSPDGNCYWARKSGVQGDFDEILANDNQSGPTLVEIRAGDVAIESSGCGTWTAA